MKRADAKLSVHGAMRLLKSISRITFWGHSSRDLVPPNNDITPYHRTLHAQTLLHYKFCILYSRMRQDNIGLELLLLRPNNLI